MTKILRFQDSEDLILLKRQLRNLDTREAIRKEIERYLAQQEVDIESGMEEKIDIADLEKILTPDQKVVVLLKQCDSLFRNKLFTTRPGQGETAFECYHEVLTLDPNNTEAPEGLKGIEDHYVNEPTDRPPLKKYIELLKEKNPESSALPTLQARLIELTLKDCQSYFKNKWYTTRPDQGETAFECYHEVLTLDPNNTEASGGLKGIEDYYLKESTSIETLQKYIELVKTKNSEASVLSKLQNRLDELEENKAEFKVEATLRTCNSLLNRGRRTIIEVEEGQGKNALDCYHEILREDPTNEGALKGLDDIDSYYVKVKDRKILKSYIGLLKDKNPESSALPALQARLIELTLQDCQSHFKNKWYTTRPDRGETAFACYQEVLILDPNNTAASEGLKEIEDHYVNGQTDRPTLKTYIGLLKDKNPESSALPTLEERLIELTLQDCQSHLKNKWYTTRPDQGETAFACYHEVLILDPNNAAASEGLKGIEDYYVNGQTDRPTLKTYIGLLKEKNPESSALPTLEERLIELTLQDCQSHLKNKWYTTRPDQGETAFACYQEVVTLEPNNTAASEGLKGIEDYYLNESTHIESLQNYLELRKAISPEDVEILNKLEDRLGKLKASKGIVESSPL